MQKQFQIKKYNEHLEIKTQRINQKRKWKLLPHKTRHVYIYIKERKKDRHFSSCRRKLYQSKKDLIKFFTNLNVQSLA